MIILWFRLDLRLEDNPAFNAAIKKGQPILPLYIHSLEDEHPWVSGASSNWWLHHALKDLEEQLQKYSLRLIIAQGPAESVLRNFTEKYPIQGIYWNRRYEPFCIQRDSTIKQYFSQKNIEVCSFNGSLLNEPHTIKNKTGEPFKVFTPFWKHCLTLPFQSPETILPEVSSIPCSWPESIPLDCLNLLPKIAWDNEFYSVWEPTQAGLKKRLDHFSQGPVSHYSTHRDYPSLDGTSCLSAYIHFGQISPRQIVYTIQNTFHKDSVGAAVYIKEVGWREFAYYMLYHFPHTHSRPLRTEFDSFPWSQDVGQLKLWQKGMTGYPIVDAGMRQLWQTGWMHNRVRMIVGSFLVKHLLQPWQLGARWFWDTLVDADLASNSFGWQWVSGCGADAAPYFRIFNPLLQGQKFDPEGHYIRKYIPELSRLPNSYIHEPWNAPEEILNYAHIHLGTTYPRPMIDLQFGRNRALEAFEQIKKNT